MKFNQCTENKKLSRSCCMDLWFMNESQDNNVKKILVTKMEESQYTFDTQQSFNLDESLYFQNDIQEIMVASFGNDHSTTCRSPKKQKSIQIESPIDLQLKYVMLKILSSNSILDELTYQKKEILIQLIEEIQLYPNEPIEQDENCFVIVKNGVLQSNDRQFISSNCFIWNQDNVRSKDQSLIYIIPMRDYNSLLENCFFQYKEMLTEFLKENNLYDDYQYIQHHKASKNQIIYSNSTAISDLIYMFVNGEAHLQNQNQQSQSRLASGMWWSKTNDIDFQIYCTSTTNYITIPQKKLTKELINIKKFL